MHIFFLVLNPVYISSIFSTQTVKWRREKHRITMNQYSRGQSTCDYCGKVMNRHNLKAHTDTLHQGKQVKERLKRQSNVMTAFLVGAGSGAKKSKSD